MRLVIVGSGYVGLVSGACFSELGNDVLCIDTNGERIEALQSGRVPIYEPGLAEMIARNTELGRLRFSTQMPTLDDTIDAVFIAVGTPPRANGQGADLRAVFSVAADIAAHAVSSVLVVTKSTVPAGTGDEIERIITEARPGLSVAVASNPEFLREGNALNDFLEPDRIVVGTGSETARQTLKALYAPITLHGTPFVVTGRRAAELIKYASNAFLAIKIAFINEMADLCEEAGADITEISKGIGLDRRIGSAFLQAGPGYGGSCFPKDTAALLVTAQDYEIPLRIVETTMAANEARKRSMGRRVIKAIGGSVRGKLIAVLGLTFKPNTDDMRDAPSLALISSLQAAGARIRAYDPEGMAQAALVLSDVEFCGDAYQCALQADCVVLATEWNEFLTLDVEQLAAVVKTRLIVDLRNALDIDKLSQAGFHIHGVGRSSKAPQSHPIVTLPELFQVDVEDRRVTKRPRITNNAIVYTSKDAAAEPVHIPR